jgi:hypothetical protein
MNPLMILKGAKMLAILAVLTYGTMTLKSCEENRVAERDATIVANANKVSAQANAATLATANAQLKAITKQRDEAQADADKAQRQSAVRVREVKKLQAEQKAMLEGNKLNDAVRNNRERIERLANKATRERFDEVEAIFDGT